MRKWSLQADTTEDFEDARKFNARWNGTPLPGCCCWRDTRRFAAFDLIMSLNYQWFSTIFGVIFWADGIRVSLVSCVLIAISLRSAGYLQEHHYERTFP